MRKMADANSDTKPISGSPLVREAAADAVRSWKYVEQPSAVRMLVAVRFHL